MKFASPEQALRWSYEVRETGNSVTSYTGRTLSSRTTNDSAAVRLMQAQSIIIMCEEKLPPLHMNYIAVLFGREAIGLKGVVEHVRYFEDLKGIHRRSIERIVRAYCGDRVGLHEIRRSLNCGMLKAVNIRNTVYDHLDSVHANAMDNVRALLQEKKMLLKVIT